MDRPASGTLCDLCRGVIERVGRESYLPREQFHTDLASLQKSVDSGCSICTRLPYGPSSFEKDELIACRHHIGDVEFTVLLFSYCDMQNGTVTGTRNHYSACCRIQAHNEELLFGGLEASLQTFTGSDQVLRIAETWLHQCERHLTYCRPNLQPNEYPIRLLEIRNDRSSIKDGVIRLVDSRRTALSGSYATLSHTWGGKRFKMLTPETMAEFQEGVPFGDFPPTFRDAIYTAHFLKIPYLWIDCYCIMQSEGTRDGEQNHEIAAMGEVYSNAILNIGASRATSPFDGCFVQHETKPPIRIELETGETYLVYEPAKFTKTYDNLISRDTNSIFKRAWCLQERFLCSRMLHFSNDGVFWECDSTRVASDMLPIDYQMSNSRSLPPFSSSAHESPSELLPYASDWSKIVSAYSSMELSRPTEDKLIACAGVAKLVADLAKDDYVAGFFRKGLVQSLAWQVYSEVPAKRAKVWRAPSWSWASMDGGVSVPFYSHFPSAKCCEVLAADCQLTDPSNPYGNLASAMLILRGQTKDAKIDYGLDGSDLFFRYDEHQLKVIFDDPEEPREDLIILFTTIHDSHPGGPFVHGLVLAPVNRRSSEKDDFYQRVGAFQYKHVVRNSFVDGLTERVVRLI